MPVLASRSLWTSAAGDDAATTAWVAAVVSNGGTVSDARKTIVNTLIVGLKADNLWTTKLDRLWLLAAENEGSALTDLVGLTLATKVNSPTFAADRGYTFNDTNNYINTLYNPNDDGLNYTLNSAHLSTWFTHSNTDGSWVGSFNGATAYAILFHSTLDVSDFEVNGTTSFVIEDIPVEGMVLASRTGSTTLVAYNNGASFGSDLSGSSQAIPTFDFYIGARNISDSPDLFSGGELAMVSFGGGLDATDVASFYSRLRTYMTALGVP